MRLTSLIVAAVSVIVLAAGVAQAERVPPPGGLGSYLEGLSGLGQRHHTEKYRSTSLGVVMDGTSGIVELPCSQDPGCVSFEVNDGERWFQIAIHDQSRQTIGAIIAGADRTYTVCHQNSRFKLDKGESLLEVRVVPTLCSSGQGLPTSGEIDLTFARNAKVLNSQPSDRT